MIDRKVFFDTVRASLFGGALSESQVAGMSAMLDAYDYHSVAMGRRQLAYVLATPYWETGKAMQPVEERGSDAYFFRMYDIKGSRPGVAHTLGNTEPGDGVRFHGRGLAQTTGRRNYARLTALVRKTLPGDAIDFVVNPAAMLDPKYAAVSLFDAMISGIYTGKCLDDYIDETSDYEDFVQARRIINGLDRAEEIAEYAEQFLAALTAPLPEAMAAAA